MSKPIEKITEEFENPDNKSLTEVMQTYDSTKLIGFYRNMLYMAALIGGMSALEGCITAKNIREETTTINKASVVVSDTTDKTAKPKTKIDIMWDLVRELGYEYAGPQKDGSYVWCGEGATLDEAIDKANKGAKELLNAEKTKQVGITVKMLSDGTWIAAIRAVKEAPLIKEKHWKLDDKKNGTVHAYCPEHKGELNEIVVFVHGYKYMKNSVDFYWGPHLHLEKQFKKSGRKALFIAPQTQRCVVDRKNKPCTRELSRVSWKGDLQGLIDFVKGQTGIKTTEHAKITVISHSGGYVTAMSWTDHPDFKEFIGSDTVYGGFKRRFKEWISKPDKKMRLFGTSHHKSPGSVRRHRDFIRSLSRDARNRTKMVITKTGHQNIPRSIHKWLKRK